MNKPFQTFVDKIFCINLEERTDRWAQTVQDMTALGLLEKLEQVPAVKNSQHPAIGLIASQHRCFQLAKERGYQHMMIMEDDTKWIQPLSVLDAACQQLPEDYVCLYLGAAAKGSAWFGTTPRRLPKITANLTFLINGDSTTAIVFSARGIDLMLDKYAACRSEDLYNDYYRRYGPADVLMCNYVLGLTKSYLVYPLMVIQYNGLSNLSHSYRCYDQPHSGLQYYAHVNLYEADSNEIERVIAHEKSTRPPPGPWIT